MSVSLATNYLPIMDEVYKANAASALLDTPETQLEFVGANSVKVFKPDNSGIGLGTYSRSNGFVSAAAGNSWETFTLSQDRGRKINIDKFDNEETKNRLLAATMNGLMREKVIPEIDAYTFAKLAGTSGIQTAASAVDITVGTTDLPALIEEGELALNENEVPYEGRILFVSPKAYSGLKSKITRTIMNGENGINHAIDMYDDMRVVQVPQGRFYTAITMYDGSSSGQTAGGYIGTASTGYKINFMIVHPSALIKCVKSASLRLFAPEENMNADAYQVDYRLYHDVFVKENKVKGIFLNKGSTALS